MVHSAVRMNKQEVHGDQSRRAEFQHPGSINVGWEMFPEHYEGMQGLCLLLQWYSATNKFLSCALFAQLVDRCGVIWIMRVAEIRRFGVSGGRDKEGVLSWPLRSRLCRRLEWKLFEEKCWVWGENPTIEGLRKGSRITAFSCERLFRRRRKKIARMAKIISAKPPITPPIIGPRLLE